MSWNCSVSSCPMTIIIFISTGLTEYAFSAPSSVHSIIFLFYRDRIHTCHSHQWLSRSSTPSMKFSHTQHTFSQHTPHISVQCTWDISHTSPTHIQPSQTTKHTKNTHPSHMHAIHNTSHTPHNPHTYPNMHIIHTNPQHIHHTKYTQQIHNTPFTPHTNPIHFPINPYYTHGPHEHPMHSIHVI